MKTNTKAVHAAFVDQIQIDLTASNTVALGMVKYAKQTRS